MKKEKTNKVNSEVSFFFLSSILQKTENFARHMDNQINILVGLSSGIFILSVSQIKPENGSIVSSLLILAVFSLFSAMVSIFAIIPPKFLRKRGQKESLLYNKKIAGFESADFYGKELNKTLGNFDNIVKEYAIELYNLSKYYYRPKRKLFKLARILLCLGVLFSLITVTFEIFLS